MPDASRNQRRTSTSSKRSVSDYPQALTCIGGEQVEQDDEGKFKVVKFDPNKKSEAEEDKEQAASLVTYSKFYQEQNQIKKDEQARKEVKSMHNSQTTTEIPA